MHEYFDASLIAAILAFIGKTGVDTWRSARGGTNGLATGAQIDKMLILLSDIKQTGSDTRDTVKELLTMARMKWS